MNRPPNVRDPDPSPEDIDLLEAVKDAMPTGYVCGVDLATDPDRTIYRCSCGYMTDRVDGLMDHALADHQAISE